LKFKLIIILIALIFVLQVWAGEPLLRDGQRLQPDRWNKNRINITTGAGKKVGHIQRDPWGPNKMTVHDKNGKHTKDLKRDLFWPDRWKVKEDQ